MKLQKEYCIKQSFSEIFKVACAAEDFAGLKKI
jgi:hypothetical protein